MVALRFSILVAVVAACSDATAPLATAEPGVIFTYPVDSQVDVPLGARVVVAFSDPVVASAIGTCTAQGGAFCLVGPNGPVAAMPTVGADGKTVMYDGITLDPAAQYSLYVGASLAPSAKNLPASGPLVKFTTRGDRPRAAAPALVAVNGGDPANPESFRPMLDTTTIQLVFSEPLDPRSVLLGAGSVELLDSSGAPVPATLLAQGIHVSIDPVADLTPGTMYKLQLGTQLVDLSGQPMAPTTVMLTPHDTKGTSGHIAQTLRTRVMGDPGAPAARTGATPNAIALTSTLIGNNQQTFSPATLAGELADPKVLNGPIAFVLRKGQRLKASGLDIALGGTIPIGLSTGDIQIELLTDAGGRIFRNPHQSPDQRPENERAPLYMDLTMDVAIYATDAKGNAALAQTILGVQGAGIVTATDGVLDIETVASMDLGLLGVTNAPSNMVLELITDPKAPPAAADTTPPMLTGTYPDASTALLPPDGAIELIFDEPIDVDRARIGGLALHDKNGASVPIVLESQGSVLVVRPRAPLAYSSTYTVVMTDIADLAGNKAAAATPIDFSTPALANSSVPPTVSAVYPGAPCALSTTNQCAGGKNSDDAYAPFSLPANESIFVAFTQPVRGTSVLLGTTVKVEDDSGTAVPGSLIRHDRSIKFIPDVPWTVGKNYTLTLISGGSSSCGTNVLCGLSDAASFDPLNGTTSGDGGGPNASFTFTGAPASASTFLINETTPATDVNGSGFAEGSEVLRDENRAKLHIASTDGSVGSAHFNGPSCAGDTDSSNACTFLQGAMPVEMMPVQQNCTLPDGTSAATCMPVAIPAGAMYGTSVNMTASVGISVTNDTGTQVMRVREPAGGGPVMGYVVTQNGVPTLVTQLDLYMDAPDMSLPLGTGHDLHSKPVSISLAGPVSNLADGRIAINAANTVDVPISITISPPIIGDGHVNLIIPQGEMHLQLVSPPLRGAPP